MPLALELGILTGVIVYLVLLIITALLVILIKLKGDVFNYNLLNILAILIGFVYVFDLIYSLATAHVIFNEATFTIGTILCPFIIITRYIKPFDKYKNTVALLSIASLFTYSIYYVRPIGFVSMDSFRIFEIYIYYALIFIYGIASLISNDVKLDIKKCYRELITLIFIESFSLMLRLMVMTDMKNGSRSLDFSHSLLSSVIIISLTFTIIILIYLIDYIFKKRKNHKKTESI